jgi:anti-sigma B factor antagonist
MELQYSERDSQIKLIKLIGSLDILGVGAIETKFAAYCSGENARVLVDLSQVDFLASIGIRLLTINAKSLTSRDGRMALLNPTPEVRKALDVTGIAKVIPVYDDIEPAETMLLAI